MLVLLDSTVLIDYLRGRPAADRVDALESSGDIPCTTAINVEEVARGLRPGEASAAEALFSGLDVFPVDRAAAWRAGLWRRDHAAVGITLSQADCLVGAVCAAQQAVLATGNPRHFPMEGLRVQHWAVGR